MPQIEREERRGALKIIGAVSATCAFPFSADELWGQTEAHAHAAAQHQPAAPRLPAFFNADDLKLVSRLADLIIPRTDTPGALDAGVPFYIDMVLSENKPHANGFRKGSEALEAKAREAFGTGFLSLTESQQIDLLTPLCEAVDDDKATTDLEQFFGMIKKLTSDGYFTSQQGLMQTLGYKGNTVVGEFPGCVHEH